MHTTKDSLFLPASGNKNVDEDGQNEKCWSNERLNIGYIFPRLVNFRWLPDTSLADGSNVLHSLVIHLFRTLPSTVETLGAADLLPGSIGRELTDSLAQLVLFMTRPPSSGILPSLRDHLFPKLTSLTLYPASLDQEIEPERWPAPQALQRACVFPTRHPRASGALRHSCHPRNSISLRRSARHA